MELSEKIKLIREQLKLNKSEFAEKLDIPQQYMSHYESGKVKPTYEFLLKLHQILNVNLNWLIGNDNTHHPFLKLEDNFKNLYRINLYSNLKKMIEKIYNDELGIAKAINESQEWAINELTLQNYAAEIFYNEIEKIINFLKETYKTSDNIPKKELNKISHAIKVYASNLAELPDLNKIEKEMLEMEKLKKMSKENNK